MLYAIVWFVVIALLSLWSLATCSAGLTGRNKMIAALERLQSLQGASQLPERVAAFGISGGGKSAWARFFSTHPALEDRIAALRANGGEQRVAHQPMSS